MKMHKRFIVLSKAKVEFGEAFLDISSKYDLTLVERAHLLQDRMNTLLMYMLRDERHPDNPSKPADVE